MKILFLDLGRRCGWCYGEAGMMPESGTVILRDPQVAPGLGLGALARWLRDHVKKNGKPDLVGIEKWLPPAQSWNADATIDALRQNGVVHAIFAVYGVNITEPPPATIRKAICGQSFGPKLPNGKRDTKGMVLRTMSMLGYLPKDCKDEDRADATCGWLYLEAVFAKKLSASFELT